MRSLKTYTVLFLMNLALAALSASASVPLYTQYVAPYTNQAWEARVVTGEKHTGRGLDFSHVLDSDGIRHNYVMEIGGRIYGAWRRWWDIVGVTYPATMTRSILTQGSPEKRYLYPLTYEKDGDSYAFIAIAYGETLEEYSGREIDDEFIVWLSINGNDGKYKFDTEVTVNGKISPEFVQLVHTDWEYEVKFDANGGTGTMPDQTYTNSTTLTANTFTHEGHTFDGWRSKDDGTRYGDGAQVSGLDLKLDAQWKINSYSVTVSSQGEPGNVTGGGTYVYGTSATITATPYTGYHFVRWKDAAGNTVSTVNSYSFTVTSHVTNIAEFEANTYTIEYNANGGTGSMGLQEATYGARLTLQPNSFERTGYTFQRWSPNPDGSGSVYYEGQTVSNLTSENKGNVTLYAVWKNNSYYVSVTSGGNGNVSGGGNYNHGTSATIAATSYTGYHFVRWKDAVGNTVTTENPYTFPVTGGVTNIAEFAANTYTIVYDKKGGDGPDYEPFPVLYSSRIDLWDGENLARKGNGYKFSGWSLSKDNVNETYSGKEYVRDLVGNTPLANGETLTLYAAWKANSFKVTFNDGDTKWISYDQKYYGLTNSLPAKIGYAFTGYYTASDGGECYFDKDGIPQLGWNIAENTTLYAHWEPIQYQVIFDTNVDDALGSMGEMTLIYDVSTNLTGNAFSRDKWLFDGWTNFEAQVRYDDGAVISNLSTVANSTITLSALWRRDTFDLALHNDDVTSYLLATNGFEYGSLPIPTNSTRAEFAGWWTSDDLNEARQVLDGDFVNRSTTTNLYARWKQIVEHQTCTVSFSADGAKSKPDSETRTVGKEIGELPTVSYEGGYELLGWYLNGKRVTSETIVPSNVTLVARKTLKAFNDAWGCYDIAFSTNGVTGWTIDGSTKIAQSREAPPPAYPKSALVFMADTDGDLSFDWLADCCPPSLHIPAPAYLQFKESGSITDYITASTEFISKSGISIICGEIYSFEYRRETKDKVGGDCGRVKNFVWCPVSASSVVDGWASLTSITSAVPEATFASGGNASWQTVGGDVVAVTNLEDNGTAWLELSLPGPGELRFDWHVSSEPGFVDTNGVEQICDYLEFLFDGGRVRDEIHGIDMIGYTSVVFTNENPGVHKYRWRYVKDDSDKAGEDSAYLKNLSWTPFTTEVEYDDPHGGDKKVVLSVPNSWVDKYSLLSAAKTTSYGKALSAYSGKKGPGGADLPYWYDYVAGTDPTNSASLFKIKSVSVVDDTVNIEWDPDLSEETGELKRVYTIWGKTNLTDAAWHTPTNSASRFFKVEVSLPE